jgi:hypothetical protein
MLSESIGPQQGNALEAAKERILLGPAPDWMTPCPLRLDFKPKQPGHVTHLLACKQLHADKRQTLVHTAIRLETIQAVQSQAQGRIPFDARTQRFTLHWLRIHRDQTVFDRTALENLRCVQPESEGFIDNGRLTLVLLLEDVRPGDVLELCYTVEEQPLLLPEHCACWFALPEDAPLGSLFFSVRFNSARPMRWLSSSPDLQPAETRQGAETLWVWTRENFPASRAEDHTPSWHISYPWIQVSDCPDWQTVAAAFALAWEQNTAEADLAAIAPEIPAKEGGILRQTEKAIQWVQDQFRYLAADTQLDGEPPAAPAVVARRRFGDCKDLSALLLMLLKRLGLQSRLVLVNTKVGKSLAGLLPMPSLFNHVVLEYQARGETRWVDATAKGQGGGSLKRGIGDFGVGLPVARSGSQLLTAPAPALEANVYQIKESVLLDTAGSPSILGIVVTARGSHAEDLRRDFETHGADAIARQRLQTCVDRFIDVQRAGAMEYRDNRTDNEFFLAEIFEIKSFLKADPQSNWYKLEVAAEAVSGLLPLPISGARRTPFALPHPCHVVHILEVYCVALPPAIVQQRTIENPWLQFTRLRKTLAGYWTVTTTLSTLADAVPPEGIDEYREAAREIRAQCAWSLQVPAGQDRPHQRSDFGKLPAFWEAAAVAPHAANALPARSVGPPRPASLAPAGQKLPAPSGAGDSAPATAAKPKIEIRYRRRKRHRRHHREEKRAALWTGILCALLVVVILLFALSFFKKTSHFLFREVTPPISEPQNPRPSASLPFNGGGQHAPPVPGGQQWPATLPPPAALPRRSVPRPPRRTDAVRRRARAPRPPRWAG